MRDWKHIFVSTAAPDWIQDFDRDPLTAVDEALRGRYYFGHLNVAEPSELLIDWAIGIGTRNDFVQRLDQALAQWISSHWGQKIRNSEIATAMAWIRLTEVVANVDSLREAPKILRNYFDARQAYLGPLSEGRSRDPLGSYLYAVARHQEDRSLESVWWNYCDLVAGIPWYHGLYGIWGLRRLPPATEAERGRFRKEVAIGLARLAVGLYRRSLDQSMSLEDAKAEFQRVAHLTLAAYPFPERWKEYWADYMASTTLDAEPIQWMREMAPGLPEIQPQGSAAAASSNLQEDKERLQQEVAGRIWLDEVLHKLGEAQSALLFIQQQLLTHKETGDLEEEYLQARRAFEESKSALSRARAQFLLLFDSQQSVEKQSAST